MNDEADGSPYVTINLLQERLSSATEAELQRLRDHLGIAPDATTSAIEQAYLRAADNSVLAAASEFLPREAPTYSRVLRLIYKELRPYADALDESWHRVKALLRREEADSPLDQLTEEELERRILALYAAEYSDLNAEVERQKKGAGKALQPVRRFLAAGAKWIPGGGAAAVSSAVTVSAHTAARLPFAAALPGTVAGPVGIALSVVLVGAQLAGPAYRKIIPATVELLLIGQRIQHTPEQ